MEYCNNKTKSSVQNCIREYVCLFDRNIQYDEIMGICNKNRGVEFCLPMNWECKMVEKRYHHLVNSLKFLAGLYESYLRTEEAKYGEAAMSYIYDFCHQNPIYINGNNTQWNDDTTAIRLTIMSVFYLDCRFLVDAKKQEAIKHSLEYHANLLCEEWFYKKRHNHGLHQDIAVIIYEILYGGDWANSRRLKIAKNRALEYLEFVYKKDGIHGEHSPMYAFDTLKDVFLLVNVFKVIDSKYTKRIEYYYIGSINEILYMTKPNGLLPKVGDSSAEEGRAYLKKYENISSPEARWFLTEGSTGKKPKESIVFPDGGYAVFRSSWEDKSENATWILFNAATHSSAHKHGDDLEVLIFHRGDLFDEGGYCGYYDYLEQKCGWSYTGYAHNVLIVDGESYPVKKGSSGFNAILPEALDTRIDKWEIGENVSRVTGFEHRFKGIEQYRTVEYNRKEDVVIIADEIKSDRAFDGRLIWHVAVGIDVEADGNSIKCYRDNDLIAEISISSKRNDINVASEISNNDHFPFVAWKLPFKEETIAGTLLTIDFFGHIGENDVTMTVYLK